jgi:hypothetical protein
MTGSIGETGGRLRKAVAREDFAEAQACVAEFSRAVTEAAGELPEGDGRALETVREAVDLLLWAKRALRASRGHTQDELARLAAGRAYRIQAVRREPAYRLEG